MSTLLNKSSNENCQAGFTVFQRIVNAGAATMEIFDHFYLKGYHSFKKLNTALKSAKNLYLNVVCEQQLKRLDAWVYGFVRTKSEISPEN